VLEQFDRHQSVVKDKVGAGQAIDRPESEQTRMARTGADQ
jgi:hypothetical protein